MYPSWRICTLQLWLIGLQASAKLTHRPAGHWHAEEEFSAQGGRWSVWSPRQVGRGALAVARCWSVAICCFGGFGFDELWKADEVFCGTESLKTHELIPILRLSDPQFSEGGSPSATIGRLQRQRCLIIDNWNQSWIQLDTIWDSLNYCHWCKTQTNAPTKTAASRSHCQGCFGAVFLGKDKKSNSPVAVKFEAHETATESVGGYHLSAHASSAQILAYQGRRNMSC